MKTYTEHEVNGLSIYVDDETGKVHHAVNWDSPNQTTLYPYAYNTRSRVWDNVSGDYTLAGLKRTKRMIESAPFASYLAATASSSLPAQSQNGSFLSKFHLHLLKSIDKYGKLY